MQTSNMRPILKKSLVLLILLLLAVALGYSAKDDIKPGIIRLLASERDWFVEAPLPMQKITQIFDMGIVDANQDGLLDIYTSNHK